MTTPQAFAMASPPDLQTGFGVGHPTKPGGHALRPGPYPSGLSRVRLYEASDSGSSRTPSPHCLPDPGRLMMPTCPVVVRAASAIPRVPAFRLPSASPASCDWPGGRVLSPPLDRAAPRGALEEVAGQQPCRLAVQELAPGRSGAAGRWVQSGVGEDVP